MITCPHCGHENPDNANFCGNCAASLTPSNSNTSSPPPISTPPTQPMSPPTEMGYQGAPPTKKTSVWVWVLGVLFVVCACGGVLIAAILFPVFAQARLAAKKTLEISKAKQVATGTMIYLADYDDRFPPLKSSSETADALAPYLKKDYTNAKGEPIDLKAEAATYQWNSELSLKSAIDLPHPEETYLFYNPSPFGQSYLVGFADSAVRFEPKTQLDTITSRKAFQ